jgi:competence ComEA-like helix-hairpin-helix protein
MNFKAWKTSLFTQKERAGILVLMVLLILIQCYRYYAENNHQVIKPTIQVVDSLLQSANTHQAESWKNKPSYNYEDRKLTVNNKRKNLHPVKFDPNTASDQIWIDWGVRPKTIQTIRRFQEKGGRFRSPEDLFRIWGLDSMTAKQMQSYVELPPNFQSSKTEISKPWIEKKKNKIDINLADSTSWEDLPGIGPVMASRIVRYRNRLGGFANRNQLHEVYGMTDSLYEKISPMLVDGIPLSKHNWNTVTESELKSHPYVGPKFARLILRFREQHPELKSWEIWKRIPGVTDSVLEKWQLYFEFK